MNIASILNTDDPILLMGSPDFYAIPKPDPKTGHANDFAIRGYEEQQKDPKGFLHDSILEWKGLRTTFNAMGVSTRELEPDEKKPDLVFTADPSLSLITTSIQSALQADEKAITLLSRFSNEQRQSEVRATSSFMEKSFPERALIRSHFRTEGTGDNVYDAFRDVYWSGFVPNAGRKNAASGRSDLRAHNTLTALTGVPVNSMAVKGPFFHIDTSMAPLTNGHIICFKNGMQPEAYKKLVQEGLDRYGLPHEEYLIEVDQADADAYACNLRCVGTTILMPPCSDGLQDILKKKGYEVVTLNMSHFIHSGGAMHCLTNNLNERRVIGGTCKKFGFERNMDLNFG